MRQIEQESGFNPGLVAPNGARGLAQFTPTMASLLGVNPNDPTSSLQGAAHWMAGLLQKWNGDYAKALAAYNAGESALVDAHLIKSNDSAVAGQM